LAPLNITKGVIDEIRSKLDIVDIVSEKVLLKKAGANYKGLCPFHNEKTPSFMVSPDKQIFRCFGCNEGGDVISFIQKTEGMTFYEAIVKLADIAGVKIPVSEHTDKNYAVRQGRRQELININTISRDHYLHLLGDKNSDAYKYVLKRKLSLETLKEFGIGYSGTAWDALYIEFVKKGISLALASELGLIKEKTGKYYDTFRDRLMFPIQNHSGDVVAFGGRLIKDSEDSPKYINSKDSELYTKGDVLYGLNKTRSYIRDTGYAVVVEGYMDLISLYQAGIKNVVATLGTSFTDKQAQLIKRYTERVVLFYDSDEAGIKAAKRSLPMLLEKGIKVDALFLDEELDPDEAVLKYEKDELLTMLSKAGPLLSVVIVERFSREKDPDSISRSTSEILDYIGMMPDAVSKTIWIKELSFRSGIPTKELNILLKKHTKAASPSDVQKKQTSVKQLIKVPQIYKRLMSCLFVEPELIEKISDEDWSTFIPQDLSNILQEVKKTYLINPIMDVSVWIEISRATSQYWIEDLITKGLLDKKNDFNDPDKEFAACLMRFKINYLEDTKKELLNKIKEGGATEKSLREYEAIIKDIERLKPLLGVLTKSMEEHA